MTKFVSNADEIRHIFGSRDSSTCANFALRKTANDNMSIYPEAALVVNEKFYMDDYLDSFENVTHAIKLVAIWFRYQNWEDLV